MILDSQKWLAKYIGKKWAYRVVFAIYFIVTSIPIMIFGLLFDCLWFMLLATFFVNTLRSYTFGAHFTNGKCLILTYCILIAFGYISKTIPLEWSFLVALFSMRYIYLNAPLRLTHKGKSRQWHRNRIQILMIGYLILSLIFLYFEIYVISNCILWSLGMVALTLFENVDESE